MGQQNRLPTIFSFSQKPSRKAPLDRSQYGKCTPIQQCGSSAALEQNELLPLGNNEESNTTEETLFYEEFQLSKNDHVNVSLESRENIVIYTQQEQSARNMEMKLNHTKRLERRIAELVQ